MTMQKEEKNESEMTMIRIFFSFMDESEITSDSCYVHSKVNRLLVVHATKGAKGSVTCYE